MINKYKTFTKLSLLLIAMIFLFISLSSVSADEWAIDNSTVGGIKGVMDSASDGDTIILQEGIYSKFGQDYGITLNKNLIICGNGPKNKVIIDAQSKNRIFNISNNLNVKFINITFINGKVDGSGGAILSNSNSSINIINCSFINNSVSNGGGALYCYNSSIYIENSSFSQNSGGGHSYGTAAYLSYSQVIVNCSIFENNFVSNDSPIGGTLATLSCNNTIVINCIFKNNTVNSGGGGYLTYDSDNVIVKNCTFDSNSAVNGGGLFNLRGNNVSFTNLTFRNNSASSWGGGITARWGVTNITNCIFLGNKATDCGGAIYNWNSFTYLSGNYMKDNSANLGNYIYNDNFANIGILNLTFVKNQTNYPKDNIVLITATLTDDMGNPITGQNISFYINGLFINNLTSIEGKASFNHIFVSEGKYIISGEYGGSGVYPINIFNGNINFGSIIDSNISSNTNKVNLDESLTIKVIVNNNGNIKESDLKIVVKLPKNFVLDNIPNGAVYDLDLNTLTWTLDTIDPSKSVVFEFMGYFTEFGNYTFNSNVYNNNTSINSSVDIEVIKNDTPTPGPTPNPKPTPKPIPVPNPTPINNETNKTSDNPTVNAVVMKPTGIPIIIIILVSLSSLGLISRKR